MLDERRRFYLLLSFGATAAFLAGWGVWIAIRATDMPVQTEPRKAKVFRQNLIKDLRVTRHGVRGVNFIKCGACRLEKRRQGVLTLGGMNMLVLEDLEVVIPPDDPSKPSPQRSGAHAASEHVDGTAVASVDEKSDAKAVVRRMGIGDGFLAERGLAYRFSGVRISKLKVSRLEGSNTVVRVFTARSAEAESDGLSLSSCRISRPEGEEEVKHAKLKRDGRSLRLEWHGGSMVVE